MKISSPELVPLDTDTAQRIAQVAVKPGCRMLVESRVLLALLNRITELELAGAVLRRDLDRFEAHALEHARLRAHAMWAQRSGADR